MAQKKVGIVLVNLGSPQTPTRKHVRQFLAEFLTDWRVIELPFLLRILLVKGFIVPFRTANSTKLYKKIWRPEGSPLIYYSGRLARQLQKFYHETAQLEVRLAMRYGQPSMAHVLAQLHRSQIDKLIILPLYPQYSATTTASIFDEATRIITRWRSIPELHFINSYATSPAYIAALAESIEQQWQTTGQPEHLLFSLHGIPQDYAASGDPYPVQCQKTTELVAQKLKLKPEQWTLVYQSRLGPRPWLQPYCDETLINLANKGVKHVDVVCPGFAVDCLETLEEVALANKKLFLKAGGSQFNYIPALNDSQEHVKVLASLLDKMLEQ